MESSRFATAAFLVGLLVFVAALVSLFVQYEWSPLAFLWPIPFVAFLPEYPLVTLLEQVGLERTMRFPVVLPLVSIACAVISFRRQEEKRLLAVAGVALVLISLLLYMMLN